MLLLGVGCLGGKASPTGPDGGVYKMNISAATWQQLKHHSVNGKIASTGDMNIASLAIDPQDASTLYAGTVDHGLLYSLDDGQSWMTPASAEVNTGRINAIAVHNKDKCVVYATRRNQVLKTSNCMRDWTKAFFDPKTDKVFTALAIDWFNPAVVYAGTSEGDIFRSQDNGGSWKAVQRVQGFRINNIAIDPKDSRILYVSTHGAGLVKSVDSGATWDPIFKPFQEFDQAKRVTQVVIDPTSTQTIYTVSRYGILKSVDGGTVWKALALPNEPGSVEIRSLAVHPKNGKFLVYATDASAVFSQDGGATWSARKLPTARGVSTLVFDQTAQPELFLGALTRPKN
ncbi:hypothetical protein FJZ48_02350 [Candidatus Uhrbacteria bacterium]|nr:hypothetical protein [Candidatus Uhrbacteria bacterium]